MNERIEQLLSVIPEHLTAIVAELCQLMYLGKTNDMPPIELTQVYTNEQSLEMLNS